MTKRKYRLSDAAIRQRRAASAAAARKRASAPAPTQRPDHEAEQEPDDDANSRARQSALASIMARFPALPRDAPNNAHQSRASLIRLAKIRAGLIQGRERGGRPKIAAKCPGCGIQFDSVRAAQAHCRKPRPAK